ncbi:MAG: hypothetical protein N2663_00460 [Chlorobi bacterium]|nr:hypothetical protein [Chlorobiota bacterium]
MYVRLFTLSWYAMIAMASETTLQLSQRAVRDWREGELSALEIKAGSLLRQKLDIENISISATFAIAVGVQLLDISDSLPTILLPTANDLRTECIISYRLGWSLDPTITVSVATQPTESFRLQGFRRVRTAKFLDPVSTQQMFGFGYAPPPHLPLIGIHDWASH